MSGWIGRDIKLSDEQIIELRKKCDAPELIGGLEYIVNEYKALSCDKRHSMKVALETLQSIEKLSGELKGLLNGLNGYDDALLSLLRRNGEGCNLIRRIESDLSSLSLNAMFAIRDLEAPEHAKAFRRRSHDKLFLAWQIKELLTRNGVKATLHRDGAWCKCLEIALEACGEKTGEPLNYIRDIQKLQKV